jgi:hypothetical protein
VVDDILQAPDTGFTVGSNQADSPKAWAEATEDKQRINTIMCGFDVDVICRYGPYVF